MPYIPNPLNQTDQSFKYDVKALLITYASEVLNQPLFTTPINGALAYSKRQALARKLLHNSDAYVEQASALLSNISFDMFHVAMKSSGGFFRFMVDGNPTGRCLLDNIAGFSSFANYNFVGDQSGISIFDKLAGITQEDMQ